MLHHGLVHDRDEWLGAVKRQGAEAAALTSRHDDCFHRIPPTNPARPAVLWAIMAGTVRPSTPRSPDRPVTSAGSLHRSSAMFYPQPNIPTRARKRLVES